ncbi:hypothetical protein OJF2_24320 [Aquisphaera giovannonii]|uniref:DUF1611 domain-containing protein n=1 Tax=Aquisphaera giovannonii TaxID=406548 RepID=A0A5B9W1P5_9BACT|nr:hypothetical protein [Aquisphaera giovannonii]QEH33900.1 hypothetical protein OJF2_24320 [Aquisphaera giovannonii]
MATPHLHASVTRISPLSKSPCTIRPLERSRWGTGDYVLAEVEDPGPASTRLELCNGRLVEADRGDLVIGALGKRFATLEGTGDWEAIGPDGRMHALTEGGILGLCQMRSALLPPMLPLSYRGHVFLGGEPTRMADFAIRGPLRVLGVPTVLIIGSSMSAGKTATARVIIRLLSRAGLRVVGAKLTGAGRYNDLLSMRDEGADHAFDFVDAGLPSTIGPADAYRDAMMPLIGRIDELHPDVAVVETGASPLEAYNSDTAISLIESSVRMTILSVGDPYASLGVMTAFGVRPDLVTGPATKTAAGAALIEKLAGVRALDVRDHEAHPRLNSLLREKLGLEGPRGDD